MWLFPLLPFASWGIIVKATTMVKNEQLHDEILIKYNMTILVPLFENESAT